MFLYRKGQELSLGRSPEHSGHSWIQKSDDGAKHPVRSRCVSLMQPQDAAAGEAQHHRSVVVADHLRTLPQAKQEQATL
jgi:hypothetical protein